MKQQPGVEILRVPSKAHYTFPMLMDAEPFTNKDVREAMKLAINREEMLTRILNGYGKVGNDQPLNEAYKFYNPNIPQRSLRSGQGQVPPQAGGPVGPLGSAIRLRDPVRRRDRRGRPLQRACRSGRHQHRGREDAGRRLLVRHLVQEAVLRRALERAHQCRRDAEHRL